MDVFYVGIAFMVAAFFEQISIIEGIAIATIVGTVATYNRNRQALRASEATAKAWESERNAALSKAEREAEKTLEAQKEQSVMSARIAALEAMPDLSRVESLIREGNEVMRQHEVNASARTDRLVAAMESIANRSVSS